MVSVALVAVTSLDVLNLLGDSAKEALVSDNLLSETRPSLGEGGKW
jgi:hypothetical protein